MKAIELLNAEVGTVSSRVDGSVAFRVITAELRPSEAGAVLAFHGKACSVLIRPHEGEPEELVRVATEKDHKTPGQRLRSVLFVLFQKTAQPAESFDSYYAREMEKVIERYKGLIDQ